MLKVREPVYMAALALMCVSWLNVSIEAGASDGGSRPDHGSDSAHIRSRIVGVIQALSSFMEGLISSEDDRWALETEMAKLRGVHDPGASGRGSSVVAKTRQGRSKGLQRAETADDHQTADRESSGMGNNPGNESDDCYPGMKAVPAHRTTQCSSGRTCSSQKYEAVCVCPLGSVWVKERSNKVGKCIPRLLVASLNLGNEHFCRDDYGAQLGLQRSSPSDFCFRVGRRDTLNLTLRINYRWMEAQEMMIALAFEDKAFLFPSVGENDIYTVEGRNETDTYGNLSRSEKLFDFLVHPRESGGDNFGVFSKHPLCEDGTFERLVYPFGSPELLFQQLNVIPLTNKSSMMKYFGGRDNATTQQVLVPLGNVSDDFISGGAMYMEVGFSSAAFRNGHCYLRAFIAFSDLPEPQEDVYTYDSPRNTSLLMLLSLIALLGVSTLLVVLWKVCHRTPIVDDTLVTNAQRRRDDRRKIKQQ
ncbi:hypothetical protein ERJ75_001670400 [Trypanosoma vivax]|uniref:Uncharacterized protein n=1 Tax=Trypanosoma vivax (strain Y486) TaxID=1055687 RepID=G0U8M4_TRYVY|nr:hypothetical protein TRVL_03547 [Trypanosoma vivax]KAH8605024.1 hypothetical protein ERJ75_001670400 [Trypanosoma vivax]CCC53951.1 conserved hypothetical protein [Trypanosoma vivax Y486]